jgi:protein-disulfide isomerase
VSRHPGWEIATRGATLGMATCALVVTILLVRREVLSNAAQARAITVETGVGRQPDWADYAVDGHSLGPLGAPLTLVEFGDFECPYCRALSVSIDSLRERYPGKIRLVYRHLPLRKHRFAVAAVRASECAHDQARFAAMHDVLYAHPDSLGVAPWSWFATQAGVLDLKQFDACITSTRPIAALARDTAAAIKLRVRGTPMLLIREKRIPGAYPLDSLDRWVREALLTVERNSK